jgi:mevalonate kinase
MLGFGLSGTTPTTIAIWVGVIGVIGLIVRQYVPWLKESNSADEKLRDLLIARVQRLEDKIERQERRHAAEQRLSNHKLRNIMTCFDSILVALKVSPDKVNEIVHEIEAMRARQLVAEAEEVRSIYAADWGAILDESGIVPGKGQIDVE